MCSCTKISFLGDHTPKAELNFTERIEVGAISDAGSVVEDDTPWDLYASPLMNEGFPVDLASKHSEPAEAPRIKRFRRPSA